MPCRYVARPLALLARWAGFLPFYTQYDKAMLPEWTKTIDLEEGSGAVQGGAATTAAGTASTGGDPTATAPTTTDAAAAGQPTHAQQGEAVAGEQGEAVAGEKVCGSGSTSSEPHTCTNTQQ